MSAYFDPSLGDRIKGYIIPDTNILSLMSCDTNFFTLFLKLSKNAQILIDPTAKLEFLRGDYQEHFLNDKLRFLTYEGFLTMLDHYKMHRDVYEIALTISRIFAQNGKTKINFGDLLIMSRIAIYPQTTPMILATLDSNDFNTLIFDRIGIITLDRITKDKKDAFSIVQFLQFNKDKLTECTAKIPQ